MEWPLSGRPPRTDAVLELPDLDQAESAGTVWGTAMTGNVVCHLMWDHSPLSHNARVVWVRHAQPWELEERLIGELDLPLNLDQNSRNPF